MASLPTNVSESTRKINPHLYPPKGHIAVVGDTQAVVVPSKPIVTEIYASDEPASLLKLNKTERRFYDWLCQGKWDHIGVQDLTFRIGYDLRYTPDFTARVGDRITIYEVKGFMRCDARAKLLATARQWSCFRWVLVRWEKNQWVFEDVKT